MLSLTLRFLTSIASKPIRPCCNVLHICTAPYTTAHGMSSNPYAYAPLVWPEGRYGLVLGYLLEKIYKKTQY